MNDSSADINALLRRVAEGDSQAADALFARYRERLKRMLRLRLNPQLRRRVALKVLPRQMFRDPKQKKRFQREARAAAGLHHTNIVPVFGVGEEDGLCYYAMQFIRGQSLDEVLAELKRMADAKAGSRPAEDADRKPEVENPRPEIGDDAPHTEPADRQGDVSAADVARSLLTGHFRRTLIACDDSDDQSPGGPPAGPPNAPHPPDASPGVGQMPASETATAGLADTAELSGAAVLPGRSDSDTTSGTRATYWQSVARIGIQAAEALQHAHEHGILHCDVKPGNLLLDTAGTVWMTDFGLAKAEAEPNLTGTGDVIGTLRYMAAEVFEGTTDERSDVCSLGLTLYELLALRPAFDQTDRHRLVRQVMSEAPPRLRAVNREVPRDLELLVHKAIDRDAATRYQTAADLQRYLNDEPLLARRPSLLRKAGKWIHHNRALSAMIVPQRCITMCPFLGTTHHDFEMGEIFQDFGKRRGQSRLECRL